MLWIRRWEVWFIDGGRSVGTKGGEEIDTVGVGDRWEGIAEAARVEIVCVIVRVRVVAAVHWEGVDIWVVVVRRESGVVLMGVGVDDGHTSGYCSYGYSVSSRRGFGSVFEFDFEVFSANIGVFSADLFKGLRFGCVEFPGAAVEEIIVCRAFFGVGSRGRSHVGMQGAAVKVGIAFFGDVFAAEVT